jgi:hypothetical protein
MDNNNTKMATNYLRVKKEQWNIKE